MKINGLQKLSLWWCLAALALICVLVLLSGTWYTAFSYSALITEQVAQYEGVAGEHLQTELLAHEREVFYRSLALSIFLTLSFLVMVVLLFRGLQQPLKEMRAGAERFAQGEFEQKLPEYYISEINALARAMDRMGSQLQHLEEVRSDFVANVSHELKTPITSIRGFVETLLDGAADDKDDLLRFLDIISKQSERLTQIIDDLLTLARLESGRIEEQLLLQEESLRSTIESAIDLAQAAAQAKEIELVVDCEHDLKTPYDRSLMEQALGNLIHNAIKYSGAESTVVVRAFAEGKHVVFSVRDSGPGIDAQHVPRLFERFYRVDRARSRAVGGTGLGLAIVKHIASVHGGTVAVNSRLGEGSEFKILLPF